MPTSTSTGPRPAAALRPLPSPAIGVAANSPGESYALVRALTSAVRMRQARFAGFPADLTAPDPGDLSVLAEAMQTFLNQAADPGSISAYDISVKSLEQAILEFFTGLTRGEPGGTYGYVTSGGTESTHHALAAAREHLPHAPVYHSPAAHDSVPRAAHWLRMPAVVVPALADDTMDPSALHAAVCAQARRGARGAIVVATVGTTMAGATDDVPALRSAATVAGHPVHLHVDAALGGLIMPWTTDPDPAPWDFGSGADSITITGKMLGLRQPAGVVLERGHLAPSWPAGPYLGSSNRTMACSRSGFAVLDMWLRLRRLGEDGLRERAHECLSTARYAETQLAAAGLRPFRPDHSITVSIPLGADVGRFAAVTAKWALPVEPQPDGALTHLVAMPHVTRHQVDRVVADIAAAARVRRTAAAEAVRCTR